MDRRHTVNNVASNLMGKKNRGPHSASRTVAGIGGQALTRESGVPCGFVLSRLTGRWTPENVETVR